MNERTGSRRLSESVRSPLFSLCCSSLFPPSALFSSTSMLLRPVHVLLSLLVVATCAVAIQSGALFGPSTNPQTKKLKPTARNRTDHRTSSPLLGPTRLRSLRRGCQVRTACGGSKRPGGRSSLSRYRADDREERSVLQGRIRPTG